VHTAPAQITHAKGVVANVAATTPGGTMEVVITMAGDLQIRLMDAAVKIQKTEKLLFLRITANKKLTLMVNL
jgi:hypothetical protein